MPNQRQTQIAIAGAGIFGLTAALELRQRGHAITIADPGPIPHPQAASNDISRMVRMDYAADRLYSDLAAQAITGWRDWNQRRGQPLYHETGFLVLTSQPMHPGAVERQSYDLLTASGHPLQRLDAPTIAARYPQWNAQHYTDGYLNPQGGWAEAGETVAYLAAQAEAAGIQIRTGFRAAEIITQSGRAVGLRAGNGDEIRADHIIAAAGVWTPRLIPELAGLMAPSSQTLIYLRPDRPENYRPPHFPPWGADIPLTGWYGFPANADGIVKLANHGPGQPADPDDPRTPNPQIIEACRQFLTQSIPQLAQAPLAYSRACFYNDTWDGDFYITQHPETEGLTIATGGSGHAFKFAPALGHLIADTLESRPNPHAPRFAWRPRGQPATEATRHAANQPENKL